MSDISIPGVSNKYNTDKLIAAMMKVEQSKLDSMTDKKTVYEKQRDEWKSMNKKLALLGDKISGLYSYDNPFNERVGISENDKILTATATRQANEEKHTFKVIQTASSDKFLSGAINKDFKVDAGVYQFIVGDKTVRLNYEGGNIQDFSTALNKKGTDILKSSLIKNTSDSWVFVIEALKTGEKNALGFQEKAIDLAEKTGMVRKVPTLDQPIALTNENIKSTNGKPVTLNGDTLVLKTGDKMTVAQKTKINDLSNVYLEFDVKATLKSQDAAPEGPPGFSMNSPGGIDFKDVHIENDPSVLGLPPPQNPKTPEVVYSNKIVKASVANQLVELKDVESTEEFVTIRIPLSALSASPDAFVFENLNTNKTLEIRNVRIFDPTSTSGFTPSNASSKARDAIFEIDGIEVTRDSNTVDDLIPGVTLNLHKASTEEVDLSIEPDREMVKTKLIEFVFEYNNVMRDLNILTRDTTDIIDEITNFTAEEKKTAMEKLGLFKGDLTLNQLRSKIQTLTMNSYPTALDSSFSLLSQMGISTHAGSTSDAYDASRMRGYLEVDEKVLDQMLQSKFEAVKQLFGRDTDGDLSIDFGAGFSLSANIRGYTQTAGIFSLKVSTLDAQIKRANDEIKTFQDQMDDKEAALKEKYGNMEGTLQNLQSTSDYLNGLNSNNNK